MRALFVDTSFWIALTSQDEERHQEAAALMRGPAGVGSLVTSSHVRGETWTFLRRRRGHHGAVAVMDLLDRTRRLSVVFVSEQLERQALRWLRRHNERPYSFVDATSFALMRSLRIREALAFDEDFTAAGFVELRG